MADYRAAEIHRDSHLSVADSETAFTEFEFALHHITESFARWSSELHSYVSGSPLPQRDVSVLQVIRMRERAKNASEIAKVLNRDDMPNILYGLRKLEKLKLISKTPGSARQTTYQVTQKGREITNRYADMRRDLLLRLVGSISDSSELVERMTSRMWMLSGFYEQAARTVSMLQLLPGEGATAERAISSPEPALNPKSKPKPRKGKKINPLRAAPKAADVSTA